MMDPSTLPVPIILFLSVFVGLILGFAYFSALRATADILVNGGHPLLGLALTLGRLSLLGVVFYGAALAGGLALLAALAGVLVAKGLMLRHTQRTRP